MPHRRDLSVQRERVDAMVAVCGSWQASRGRDGKVLLGEVAPGLLGSAARRGITLPKSTAAEGSTATTRYSTLIGLF